MRVEKYTQLSRPGGSSGKSSLCLEYHSFWTSLRIFQASRYRQWAVVLSSSGYLLSSTVLPNLQSYVFLWTTYHGGTFSWGASYSWQVAQVVPYWAQVSVGILAVILSCVITLAILLALQKTGLLSDPVGIASLVQLVLTESPTDLGFNDDDHVQSSWNIRSHVNPQVFKIQPVNGHLSLSLIRPITNGNQTAQAATAPTSTNANKWSGFQVVYHCKESLSDSLDINKANL